MLTLGLVFFLISRTNIQLGAEDEGLRAIGGDLWRGCAAGAMGPCRSRLPPAHRHGSALFSGSLVWARCCRHGARTGAAREPARLLGRGRGHLPMWGMLQ